MNMGMSGTDPIPDCLSRPALPIRNPMDKPVGFSDGRRVKRHYSWPSRLPMCAFLLMAVFLCGCVRVGVHEQRLVSKPNMTFDESVVFGTRPALTVQIEPGTAFSGGAQAGGCTSCK